MKRSNHPTITTLLAATLLFFSGSRCRAQAAKDDQKLPSAPHPTSSFSDLNYLDGDAAVPTLLDSAISPHSRFRQSLLKKGMALRVVVQLQYAQNMLQAPVPAHDQVYVGQRPFEGAMVQPILTADLHQLHLRHTQLYIGGVWNWVSWNPAGPKSFQLWDLYLYKSLGQRRAEIKAGYISMNLDFVGLFVGGSTATGGQGVYAVLPYEDGMSYFPLTSPAFTLRLRGPKHTYFKFGAQRSIDPSGGPTEVKRNHTGFRFIPHGDKLLLINEAGYQRNASDSAHEAWFRAGYMHNSTAYSNVVTGQPESGNYCGYVLMDYQLHRSSLEHPGHGLYLGGTFMTVPDTLNAYTRYYELRFYKEAPFRSRPTDLLSFVATRTNYSRHLTDSLVTQGKTVWRDGTTLTASYALHASPGNYLGAGVSYMYGPAITPRVSNAFKFIASWTTYF